MLKISIITVSYNSAKTIEDTIKSVLFQTYPDIEYVIIDGGSTDGTVEIVNKYRSKISKFVSEQDRGIYDAMNKGIESAAGEIIGILNSDDVYAENDVIEKVVQAMQDKKTDSCWGDLVYVGKENPTKPVIYWKSSEYAEGKFKNGWMPPHPAFFARRGIYEKYGGFNLNFGTAADYELMLRFLEKHRISSCHISKILVKMRMGGESNKSVKNLLRGVLDSYRAWEENGLKINFLRFLLKPLTSAARIIKSIFKINP